MFFPLIQIYIGMPPCFFFFVFFCTTHSNVYWYSTILFLSSFHRILVYDHAFFHSFKRLLVYHYIFPPLIQTYIGITTCFSATHPNVYWYITMFFFHTFKRILVYNFVIPPLTQTYIGIKSHSHDLFSKTIAPMVTKFHMQHDEAAGLQNDKIQPGRESKMAAIAKNR